MQIQLYLARHAHAEPDSTSDAARPLSPKGRRQMDRLVAGLEGKGLLVPEVIWQSGLVRAEETATALKEGLFPQIRMCQKPGLAPYDDPAGIAARIGELHQSCLVVGHEPNLSRLATLLLGSRYDQVVFAKASILCLSRMKIAASSTPWQIEWHISHHFFK